MINIAIDGYAGSGKGELSKGLAKKLNLKHLDTGAILRAMGLYFARLNIEDFTQSIIDKYIKTFEVKVQFEGDKQITLLNREDVSKEIKTEKMGGLASKLAIYPEAMEKMNNISREFAENFDCVIDGRNITSEVLPNADVKFFLDASVECRANRRLQEDFNRGVQTTFAEVLESLKKRDYRDTHREFSRMVVTHDSIVVDNTNMTIAQTIEHCYNIAVEKLKELGKI